MRYYVIAGEASGDMHGSRLVQQIHQQDPKAEIRCWGGEKMQAAGATLVKHYKELAFMGFVEVIKHLPTIFRNIRWCKRDILSFKPDVLVLIDYPGFNLRIAKWAHQMGIKVAYYISPQVWAWKENRVKTIKKVVDTMLVILPFEVDFYKKWDMEVTYTGHPLIEFISEVKALPAQPSLSPKPIIALLPGSRAQEIQLKLPIMLEMVALFPQYQFAVAQAPSQPNSLYIDLIGSKDVLLIPNNTYGLLLQAKAALVTSGTATLETALIGVPQIVCYKGNAFSFWLAKKLVKVKYISLVNLIMDKLVVTELIQNDLNISMLQSTLTSMLKDEQEYLRIKSDYKELWHLLGNQHASLKAAQSVVALAQTAHK